MQEEGTPVEIVDENAYQEFIYCPYCYHRHNHVPGWENWGMIFRVICARCGLVFTARIIRLVIHEEGNRVWLGTGFDSEKDSINTEEDKMHAFYKTLKPQYSYLSPRLYWGRSPTGRCKLKNSPPIQPLPGTLADIIDKAFFW